MSEPEFVPPPALRLWLWSSAIWFTCNIVGYISLLVFLMKTLVDNFAASKQNKKGQEIQGYWAMLKIAITSLWMDEQGRLQLVLQFVWGFGITAPLYVGVTDRSVTLQATNLAYWLACSALIVLAGLTYLTSELLTKVILGRFCKCCASIGASLRVLKIWQWTDGWWDPLSLRKFERDEKSTHILSKWLWIVKHRIRTWRIALAVFKSILGALIFWSWIMGAESDIHDVSWAIRELPYPDLFPEILCALATTFSIACLFPSAIKKELEQTGSVIREASSRRLFKCSEIPDTSPNTNEDEEAKEKKKRDEEAKEREKIENASSRKEAKGIPSLSNTIFRWLEASINLVFLVLSCFHAHWTMKNFHGTIMSDHNLDESGMYFTVTIAAITAGLCRIVYLLTNCISMKSENKQELTSIKEEDEHDQTNDNDVDQADDNV